MRALVLGPDQTAAIEKLVAYAQQPEHWFYLGATWIPGNDPNYVVYVPHGFRCVFTFTVRYSKRYRHLTVSVDGPNLPSPEAVVMLAEAFGFTSSGDGLDIGKRIEKDDWMVAPGHEGENCIVAAQEVKE